MSKRYKVKRFSSCYLMNWVDNKTNKELTALEIEEILHKQEKRIAELEEQLKQSQNQVAISELEKIYNLFEPYENSQKDTILCANNGISFVDYLENQIKSLKGEE